MRLFHVITGLDGFRENRKLLPNQTRPIGGTESRTQLSSKTQEQMVVSVPSHFGSLLSLKEGDLYGAYSSYPTVVNSSEYVLTRFISSIEN